MTNKELQTLLQEYPDDMPIKLLPKSDSDYKKIIDLTDENILHTSETAWYREAQEEDEQDEHGLGDGQQYILFNPIIY